MSGSSSAVSSAAGSGSARFCRSRTIFSVVLPPRAAIARPHFLDAYRGALLHGLFRDGVVHLRHQIVCRLVAIELAIGERDEDRAARDDVTDASRSFDLRAARDH